MAFSPRIRRAEAGDAPALTRLMLASSAYAGDYHAIIADYPVTPAMIAGNELWLAEDAGSDILSDLEGINLSGFEADERERI